MRAWGSRYARIVVDRCQGNKRKACRVLGISYHTLQSYLKYEPDATDAAAAADWPRDGLQEPAADGDEVESATLGG